MIRRYHVQGTCLGIVQGEPVVPLQDVLYRLVLQQADLLAPHIAPQDSGLRLGAASQQQIDRRRPDDGQQDDQTDPF